MSPQNIYLSVSTSLWARKSRLVLTELCQGKISLLSQGKARVLTLAQLFCISKDVRWERKWRVWIGDGPGTGRWDKRHQESRPPSSRWSCLVLIGCATSQLLFLLVWESILCHLRYCSSSGSPQRDYRWDQLFGAPLLASRSQGRPYRKGFRTSHQAQNLKEYQLGKLLRPLTQFIHFGHFNVPLIPRM